MVDAFAPRPPRCAIYCRSAVAPEPSAPNGLDAQEAACRRRAAERGYAVVGVYAEVGSGVAETLPRMEDLRRSVASGGVDVVLVAAPDRLSRGLRRCARLVGEFRAAGAAVEAVAGGEALAFLSVREAAR